jgi:hypothetical protein
MNLWNFRINNRNNGNDLRNISMMFGNAEMIVRTPEIMNYESFLKFVIRNS